MPANAIYVGRPSPWGNPFPAIQHNTQDIRRCIEQYRQWAWGQRLSNPNWLEPLQGKDLACWCPLHQPCHADVLLELANPDLS